MSSLTQKESLPMIKPGDAIIKYKGDYQARGVVICVTDDPPRYLVKVTEIIRGNLLMIYAPHQIKEDDEKCPHGIPLELNCSQCNDKIAEFYKNIDTKVNDLDDPCCRHGVPFHQDCFACDGGNE